MERSNVRKYFENPEFKMLLATLGIPMLMSMLVLLFKDVDVNKVLEKIFAGMFLLFVIGGTIGGAIWGYIHFIKDAPTDEQIDELIADDIKRIQKEALSKVGIEESELIADSDVIWGGSSFRSDCFVGLKKGKDKKIRQTPQPFLVLNYTQNQIVTYRCDLDLDTGAFLSPTTEEYFYKDIVSVKTKSEGNEEEFYLNNSGGDSLSINIVSAAITEKLGEDVVWTSKKSAEKAINNIRRLLREKKA